VTQVDVTLFVQNFIRFRARSWLLFLFLNSAPADAYLTIDAWCRRPRRPL